MPSLSINQDVAVRWRLPDAGAPDGTPATDLVVRTFANLIPACEFAVAMAREGNLAISLHPHHGPALALEQAQVIASDWETGRIALNATEVEI